MNFYEFLPKKRAFISIYTQSMLIYVHFLTFFSRPIVYPRCLSPVSAFLLFCRGSGALLTSSFEIPCSTFDIHSMSILCLESRVLISVKIGKNSARNQPKARIPSSKNQIFQKFFNCLAGIELRESRIKIRGLFSYQIRR